MYVVLDHIEPQNQSVNSFWFKPDKPWRYTAGQFIELTLPHDNPDERGIKHWFTLSSSPTEPLLAITTKFAERSSTFKTALGQLKPGDQVTMSEPMGDFVLPQDKTIPLVFVAGGIGVTPFRSMTKWLLDTGEQRNLQVILAARAPEDIVFAKLFEAYGIPPTLIISNPPPDWPGISGQLSAEKILELVGDTTGKRIYISGPEPMVETLNENLLKLGVPKNYLVGDYFPGYLAP